MERRREKRKVGEKKRKGRRKKERKKGKEKNEEEKNTPTPGFEAASLYSTAHRLPLQGRIACTIISIANLDFDDLIVASINSFFHLKQGVKCFEHVFKDEHVSSTGVLEGEGGVGATCV